MAVSTTKIRTASGLMVTPNVLSPLEGDIVHGPEVHGGLSSQGLDDQARDPGHQLGPGQDGCDYERLGQLAHKRITPFVLLRGSGSRAF